MIKNITYFFMTIAFAMVIFACKDDDSTLAREDRWKVSSANINSDNYTGPGPLSIEYSLDGGTTYTSQTPYLLKDGDSFLARVTNGSSPVSLDHFIIDWSQSENANIADAEQKTNTVKVTIDEAYVKLSVSVMDKITLVASHRSNGKIFKVDTMSGNTTEWFTPSFDGGTLTSIRGFVYHPKMMKYYVTLNTNAGGGLYTLDPKSKEVVRINNNSGNDGAYAVWDAVVNWAVAADDSLVSVGDFNNDGNGVVKFGPDGGRSMKTLKLDICCALGMLYDKATNTVTVANAWDTNTEVLLEEYPLNDLDLDNLKTYTITEYKGFPNPISSWPNLRSLAKSHDGKIFGLLYSSNQTFFVRINLEALTIDYISTIGADNSNQYHSLAFVPNHTL